MAASQCTHAIFKLTHPIAVITAPIDFSVPPAAAVLIIGMAFLAGFALGMTVEYVSLHLRERQLARGRRLIAAQARGLRQQLLALYEQRDNKTAGGQALPKFPPFDEEERQP